MAYKGEATKRMKKKQVVKGVVVVQPMWWWREGQSVASATGDGGGLWLRGRRDTIMQCLGPCLLFVGEEEARLLVATVRLTTNRLAGWWWLVVGEGGAAGWFEEAHKTWGRRRVRCIDLLFGLKMRRNGCLLVKILTPLFILFYLFIYLFIYF